MPPEETSHSPLHLSLGEKEYKDWIIKQVRELHISGEEGEVGPFSVNTYLQYMLKDRSWGDNIMLAMIASMWGGQD